MIRLDAYRIMIVLGSIVNIIWGGERELYDHFMSIIIHLHVDNEYDVSSSSKNYEECSYNISLDLLTILYYCRLNNKLDE